MRGMELLRLVWLNLNQNKFKAVMTSIGIIVGAATIVMVIGIGRGGQMEVAEQFSSLNAGAIDISYEWAEEETQSKGKGFSLGGFSMGGITKMFGAGQSGSETGNSNAMKPGSGNVGTVPGMDGGSMQPAMPEGTGTDTGNSMRSFRGYGAEADGGTAPERAPSASAGVQEEVEAESETDSITDGRMNQENIILTAEDVEDIELFVSGISGATISYRTRSSVEGGSLTEAQTYTIAGVMDDFASVSKLEMEAGEFLNEQDNDNKSRVCVLGSSAAKELFGTAQDAYESTIYIDDRAYVVSGVLETSSSVSAGISPDESIFIPYQTGIKYITGESISPVITVIAEDVTVLNQVISSLETVLAEKYSDAEFTFSDAGSKMEAAESSNQVLTLLLAAMAVIVFIVGGIGIMNVLFVSVKERTAEIGILKAIGASRRMILLEFLLESAAISLLGGILGVAASFLITPIVEYYSIRVEAHAAAWLAALGFAVLTGTLFGIYPAWKASRLVPVEALNAE